MKSTVPTIDKILHNYLKDVRNGHPMMQVILRERLHAIATITLSDLNNNPTSYNNSDIKTTCPQCSHTFNFQHSFYAAWANETIEAMQLEDNY